MQHADFPVVIVGASAGGLSALRAFLTEFEPCGAAVIVVQHLAAGFDSRLAELLRPQMQPGLEIVEVRTTTPLRPDTIFVMTPGIEMMLAAGQIVSSPRQEHTVFLPIDLLLRSAAQELGALAIAVILSGTGADGSRGCIELKASGGTVLVQEPESAEFDGMPRAVIDTGIEVDAIDGTGELAQRASLIARELAGSRGLLLSDPDAAQPVVRIMNDKADIDLSAYKPSSVTRRIERRMLELGLSQLDTYLEQLESSAEERRRLHEEILVCVTSFFRDAPVWKRVARLLTALVTDLPSGERLRVWCAGCGTGEEAYTLAILCTEAFRYMGRPPSFRIFATDVSEASLQTASEGEYDRSALAGLSPHIAETYFRAGVEGRVHVTSELRSHMVFAHHDLLGNAPFTQQHLVSCRNVLIYLRSDAQRRLCSVLSFSLKAGGVLVLGPSESLSDDRGVLRQLNRRWSLYQREGSSTRGSHWRPSRTPVKPVPASAQRAWDESSLVHFGPPRLYVDGELRLLRSVAGASRYLRLAEGPPSDDLSDLLLPALREPTLAAASRARDMADTVAFTAVLDEEEVRVQVVPVSGEGGVVIAFPHVRSADVDVDVTTLPELAARRIRDLEAELRDSRSSLDDARHAADHGSEELHTANEELLTTNEELQGANEELYSLNREHQQKIRDLREASTDLQHLLRATEVDTLFLDRDLCIRRFTEGIERFFPIRQSDVGRSIESFAHRLPVAALTSHMRAVIETGERFDLDIVGPSDAPYLLRLLPYSPDDEVDGVVLTLVDVSTSRRTELALAERESTLAALFEHAPFPIVLRDDTGTILFSSNAARQLGWSTEHPSHFDPLDLKAMEHGVVDSEETSPDGRRWQCLRFPFDRPTGPVGLGTVWTDITDRVQAQEQVQRSLEARDRFLAVLSHELRNPLAAATSATALLRRAADSGDHPHLELLQRQLTHMNTVLRDLLEVSRMVSDKLDFRRTLLDADDLITASVEAVRHRADRHGVSLELRGTPPPGTCYLHADGDRIMQALVNVLRNAVDSGGSHVEVQASLADDELTVRVVDDGPGLPDEAADRAFDPFYQADRATVDGPGGLGLGLTLARRFAEGHDGSLRALPTERGACFEFVFPTSPPPTGDAAAPTAAPGRSLRILLVEDQTDVRMMMRLLLEAEGHEVHEAVTGEAAVGTLTSAIELDVALVDLGLPDFGGLDVARQARTLGCKIPLIALTGYGTREDRERSLAAGFDVHLTKPVPEPELLDVLARVHRAP